MAGVLRLTVLAGVTLLAGCRGVLGIEDPVGRDDASLPDDAALDAPASEPLDALVPIDAVPTDAPPALPTLQYLGRWSSTANTSTYRFFDVPLGAASPDRHVIVVAHGRSVQVPFGQATVKFDAGPDATRIVGANETMIGSTASLHIAAVPDGRVIEDITLRFSDGSGDRCAAISVWVAYDLTSATPVATGAIQDGVTASQLTLDLPAGGVLVAGAAITIGSNGTTVSWSGIGADYEVLVETMLATGGSTTSTVTQARTVTFTAPDAFHRVVAASFR